MEHLTERLNRRISGRTIDGIECLVSVLLAICFAHLLGASNMAWAAFAGYMVMRGHVVETLSRAILRVVGTMAGGVIALALIPVAGGGASANAVFLFVMGTVTLYGALTTRRSYAWLFFGLTYAMVTLDKLEQPDLAVRSFVETRVLETLAGTLACVIVSVASALSLRRFWPAALGAPAQEIRWHPDAARHAAQAGVALASLVLLSHFLALPALSQGAITVMAVMMIPVSGIGTSGFVPVSRRILHRFIGCIAGAAYALLVLLMVGGHAAGLILGTSLGVVVGRHIENGEHAWRYVGTQFTLAMLVVLVPDSYDHAVIGPALERLSGILVGMAVLEPILLLWHLLSPLPARWRRRGGNDR